MWKKILFFAYLGFITVLSLLPASGFPEVKLFLHADKLIHLCMYAGFTFLLLWGWPRVFTGFRQLYPLAIIFFWGLFIETLQEFCSVGRSFELADILANMLGFLPGWIFWKLVNRCGIRDP